MVPYFVILILPWRGNPEIALYEHIKVFKWATMFIKYTVSKLILLMHIFLHSEDFFPRKKNWSSLIRKYEWRIWNTTDCSLGLEENRCLSLLSQSLQTEKRLRMLWPVTDLKSGKIYLPNWRQWHESSRKAYVYTIYRKLDRLNIHSYLHITYYMILGYITGMYSKEIFK